MLDLFEVFDAPAEVLQNALRQVRIALPDAHGPDKLRLQQLRDTIQQELDERGASGSVMDQVRQLLQSANPDTWAHDAPALMAAAAAAPGDVQKELLELVQAGQRIAALRQQALDAPTAQPSTAPAAQTRTHAAAAPAATMAVPSPVPAQQRSTHDVGPGSAQVPLQASPSTSQIPASGGTAGSPQEGCIGLEASASAQEGDADVDEEEGGQEASPGAAGKPAAPSKPMSVMEAALAAFKEEQRKLHKARKAITKKAAAPAISRHELLAAYRGPPAAASASAGAVAASPLRAQPAAAHVPHAAAPQQQRPQPKASLPAAAAGASAGAAACVEPAPAHVQQEPQAQAESSQSALAPAAPAQVLCLAQDTEHGTAIPLLHPAPPNESIHSAAPKQQEQQQQHRKQASSRPASGAPAADGAVAAAASPLLPIAAPEHSQPNSDGPNRGMTSTMPQPAVSSAVRTEAPNLHPAHGAQPRPSVSIPLVTSQGPELQSEASSTEYASEDEESPTRLQQPQAAQQPLQPGTRAGPCWQPEGPGQTRSYMHARVSPRDGTGMRVDRFSEWDLDNDQGVSAWGRETEDDAVASHLQTLAAVPRAAGHVPPAVLPQGAYLGTGRTRPGSARMPAAGAAVAAGVAVAGGAVTSQGGVRGSRSPAPNGYMHTSSEEEESSGDEGGVPHEGGQGASSTSVQPTTPSRKGGAAGAVQQSMAAARISQQVVPAGAVVGGRPGSGTRPPATAATAGPAAAAAAAGPATHVAPAAAPSGPLSQPQPGQLGQTSQPPSGTSPKPTNPTSTANLVRPPSASPLRPTRPPVAVDPEPAPGSVYASLFSAFHDVLSICYSGPLQAEASSRPGPKPPQFSFNATEVMDKFQGLTLRVGAWLQAERARGGKATAAGGAASFVGSSQTSTALVGAVRELSQQGCGAGRGLAPGPAISSTSSSGGVQAGGAAASTLRPASQQQASDVPLLRYFAIADDTLHPEVRQMVHLALAGLPGWAPDPIDQITEVGKPDPYDDDASTDGPAGSCDERPGSSHGATSPSPVAGMAGGQGGTLMSTGVPTQQRSPLAGRCNMWNLLWSWSVKARPPQGELLTWQRFNHFPEARQLSRKDLLKKHLVRYQVMHGGNARLAHLFSCLPTTFVLPKEAQAFVDAFQKAAYGVEPSVTQPKGLNLWMLKPVGLSRGRGIKLVRSLREIGDGPGSADEPQVVQRYVTNPLTVQGCKFDLRLYVLVTCFNPLEAWLCREGFARFATLPFSLAEEDLGNRFIHLTNSSVQKVRAEQGQLPPFLADAVPPGGSKCSLTRLRELLSQQHIAWDPLWSRIREVVTACLFAAQEAIPPCVNAFELFGFDVLLDTAGGVWVLEVNGSPSLSLDTPLDRAVKPRMLRDAIAIVDPLPFDREALLQVLGARSSSRGRLTRRPAPGAPGGNLMAGTAGEERALMCADLQQVLRGRVMRKYGEVPEAVEKVKGTQDENWFECLAPSPLLDKLNKLKKPLGP